MEDFAVEGNPIAWKRAGHRSIGGTTIVYDKQKMEKEQFRWWFKSKFKKEPFTCPLKAEFIFNMPIPKSVSRRVRQEMLRGEFHHMKKPDIDNLVKFYFDAMNGLAYHDDAQIFETYLKKQYSDTPCVKITLTPYSRNDEPEEVPTVEDYE